jgi:predicted TPR repeat methyltransferase
MGNTEKFDLIANRYDTDERIRTAGVIADRIRGNVAGAAGKCAIDYGCGTGLVGMRLLDVFGRVLFVDASPKMVEVVRRKIEDGRIPNADALLCDLTQENPPDLHADCIIAAQVLLHIKDVELLLPRLRSALNDGGHLLIVDFDKNSEIVSDEVHAGFDRQALAETLCRSGFRVEKSATFYRGKRLFMNKDASLFMLDAVKVD